MYMSAHTEFFSELLHVECDKRSQTKPAQEQVLRIFKYHPDPFTRNIYKAKSSEV